MYYYYAGIEVGFGGMRNPAEDAGRVRKDM